MFGAGLGTPPTPIVIESGIGHPQRARGLTHHQTPIMVESGISHIAAKPDCGWVCLATDPKRFYKKHVYAQGDLYS